MANVNLAYEPDLGEIQIGSGPRVSSVVASNVAGVPLRQVQVTTQGEGADYVELALDDDGIPGDWGESISLDGELATDGSFVFWERVNTPDTAVDLGEHEFQLAVQSKRFI